MEELIEKDDYKNISKKLIFLSKNKLLNKNDLRTWCLYSINSDNYVLFKLFRKYSGAKTRTNNYVFSRIAEEGSEDKIYSLLFHIPISYDILLIAEEEGCLEFLTDHPNFTSPSYDGKLLIDMYTRKDDGESNMNLYKKLMSLPEVQENLISIETEEEIIHWMDTMNETEKGGLLFPVIGVYSVKDMMKYGFLPEIDNNKIITDYINGYTLDSIAFWNESTDVKDLKHFPVWSYKTLSEYKKIGEDMADSTGLLLFAPELLYEKSKRPITDMRTFKTPMSITISKDKVRKMRNTIFYSAAINGEKWILVPVTRYSTGMSRGLYYGKTNKKSCGTFYYYEPESSTMLAFRKQLTTFNKYEGVKLLDTKGEYEEELEKLEDDNLFMMYTNKQLKKDLMYTPVEYAELTKDIYNYFPEEVSKLDQKPHYAGELFYAYEDHLDQALCILGKRNNYDIIVMESMPGSHQIVGEVLDTRSRMKSFENLVYLV